MRRPNFFIVGAARSGTSSIYTYLKGHPNIFFCSPKEPRYFNRDVKEEMRIHAIGRLLRNDREYLRLFRHARPRHLAVGEATTGYIYSKVAIRNIYEFNPDAKLIVMLRNPADAARSRHAHNYFCGREPVAEFRKAWRLQEARLRGEAPRKLRGFGTLQYRDPCLIGEQLERLYSVFPREQVLTILFDDFVADTREVYEKALAFLGLPSDSRTEFPRVNESSSHRIAFLNHWLMPRTPPLLNRAVRDVKDALGIKTLGIRQFLLRFNTAPRRRKRSMDPVFRQELIDAFTDDIRLLGRLIGRDLDHWLEGGSRPRPPKVCICIATHRRPRGLERLLTSLRRLELRRAPDAEVQIAVVDNEPGGPAREIVEKAREDMPWEIAYEIEEKRGISHARNRLAAMAAGDDFIAFIDDDESAQSQWLDELLVVQRETNADAVIGTMAPTFEEEPSRWLRPAYDPPTFPNGAIVDANVFSSSNLLISMDAIADLDPPFELAFNITGGEDAFLGRVLSDRGCRFAFSPRAVVQEHLPRTRTRAGWLFARHFSSACVWARMDIRQRGPLIGGAIRLAKAVVGLAIGLALLPLAVFPWGRFRVRCMHRIGRGLGSFAGLFGYRHRWYQETDGE